jgi:hypothetical protein
MFIIIDEDYDYSPSMILGYTDTREEAEKFLDYYISSNNEQAKIYKEWALTKSFNPGPMPVYARKVSRDEFNIVGLIKLEITNE